MRSRIIDIVFKVVVIYVCCFGLFTLSVIVSEYDDNFCDADAIAVLTGDHYRIQSGIKLAEKLPRNKIVFLSGVHKSLRLECIRHIFQVSNPDIKIEAGYNAKDTVGNTREICEWCINNDFKNVIVVTSDYHIPRTIIEFNKNKTGIKLHFFAVKSTKFNVKFYKKCFKEFNGCIWSCIN